MRWEFDLRLSLVAIPLWATLACAPGFHADADAAELWLDSGGPCDLDISQIVLGMAGDGYPLVYALDDASDRIFRTLDRGDSWERLQPADVQCIACSRDDPNLVYAAVAQIPPLGVLYESTDGGLTFTQVSVNLPFAMYRALAISPYNPSVLFLGSIEGSFFVSVDGGRWWNEVTIGGIVNPTISAILVGPSPLPGEYAVLVASDDGNPAAAGVYVSLDSGANWSRKVDGFVDPRIRSLGIDSAFPTFLVPHFYAGAMDGRIYRSSDWGDGWALKRTFSTCDLAVQSIAGSDDVVFAVVGTGVSSTCPGGLGVWKSADRGDTWALVNQGIPAPMLRAVASEPDPQYSYVGGVAFYRTSDGGRTWEERTPCGDRAEVSAIALGGGSLFAAAGGVLHESPVYEEVAFGWEIRGDPTLPYPASPVDRSRVITDLAVLRPPEERTLYAGITDPQTGGGVVKSEDGGRTWSLSLPPNGATGSVRAVAIHPLDSGIVYAGGRDTSGRAIVYRSIDAGTSWHTLHIAEDGQVEHIFTDVAHERGGDVVVIIIAGSGEVFRGARSLDEGVTWTSIAAGLPEIRGATRGEGDCDPDAVGPGPIYAATAGGVYRTCDLGDTWLQVSQGLAQQDFVSIAAEEGPAGALYAAANDASGEGHVFRSADGGLTWEERSPGLPPKRVEEIVVACAGCGAGTAAGRVYAATGAGVFYLDAEATGVAAEATAAWGAVALSPRVSPNPFRELTEIQYSLPREAPVRIRLLDTNGRAVHTWNRGSESAGEHHLTLDGSALPGGVYFYRIEAGGESLGGKVVRLR